MFVVMSRVLEIPVQIHENEKHFYLLTVTWKRLNTRSKTYDARGRVLTLGLEYKSTNFGQVDHLWSHKAGDCVYL